MGETREQASPAPAGQSGPDAILEKVIVGGDLKDLTPAQRVAYYARVCESLGLNPFTRPFEYLWLNGRLILYATRTATDQLARQHGLRLSVVKTEQVNDVYLVTARATGPDGRYVENVGAVSIGKATSDALANLLMKAVTKAYRRATLSYCGLGWMDESEIETTGGVPQPQPQLQQQEQQEQQEQQQIEAPAPHHAEPAPGKQDAEYVAAQRTTCSDCQREITPVEIDGRTYGVRIIRTRALKDYGVPLCYDCMRRRRAGAQS